MEFAKKVWIESYSEKYHSGHLCGNRVDRQVDKERINRHRKLGALIDTKQEAINYRSICHVDKK